MQNQQRNTPVAAHKTIPQQRKQQIPCKAQTHQEEVARHPSNPSYWEEVAKVSRLANLYNNKSLQAKSNQTRLNNKSIKSYRRC
ncbi:hypothetical protein LIER_13473 [Lithospermum erythrorhizon]|uniref:Uncharacterized protein n=1 Tax=Lithospermum erythrorhizon TaxID=34254 RepID=A0AAV3PXR5_LITER